MLTTLRLTMTPPAVMKKLYAGFYLFILLIGRLKLNAAKINVLLVGYESDPEPILTLDGTTIDVCDICNNLGLVTLSFNVATY